MEEVLEVYERPADPQRPLVCVDELHTQLIGETRVPIAATTGQVERVDYEYVRNGTANIFMAFEPLSAYRLTKVTARRTRVDFAELVRDLVDVHYPTAEAIVLILDHLNTHSIASLYQAFKPEEARRLARKLEIHYTPKHGSWLNMAEIELSALSWQGLARRISDKTTLDTQVAAWTAQRNASGKTVTWRFTTADARIKLRRLYPSIHD